MELKKRKILLYIFIYLYRPDYVSPTGPEVIHITGPLFLIIDVFFKPRTRGARAALITTLLLFLLDHYSCSTKGSQYFVAKKPSLYNS
jgi:hypothetical protein